MFITYLTRELRRRSRSALVVVLGLALGIGLVVTVTAATAGVRSAQAAVLHSLYGVGTDITVTKAAQADTGGPGRFDFGNQSSSSGSTTQSQDRVTAERSLSEIAQSSVRTIASRSGVAAAVGALTLTDMKVSGTFTPTQGTSGTSSGTSSGASGTSSGASGSTSGTSGNGYSGQSQSGVRPQISIDSFSIAGVDTSRSDVGPLSSVTLASGRGLATSDANSAVVLVNSTYATQKSLKVNSTMTISGTTFTVIGIVTVPTSDSGSDVYMPLTKAQVLAGATGKVNTIYVKAASASQISGVQKAIEKALPSLTVTTSSDLANEVSGSLSSAASLANNLGKWLSIAVLLASFGIAALFTLSAVSRRVREFGTLKALGWRSRRIIRQVVGETLVQGLIGGLVGIGLGYLGAFLVTRFAPTLTASAGTFGFGGRASSGASSGGPGGAPGGFGAAHNIAPAATVHLHASVALTVLALAVALAVAGGLIAGAFGGWRASRMRPADALRSVA